MSQTQELARAQMRTEMFLAEQESTRFRIESPVMEIMGKRGRGEPLTPSDYARLAAWAGAEMRQLNHQAYLASQGLYEIDQLEAELQGLVSEVESQTDLRSGFCRWWPDRFEPVLLAMAESMRERLDEVCE